MARGVEVNSQTTITVYAGTLLDLNEFVSKCVQNGAILDDYLDNEVSIRVTLDDTNAGK